MIESYELNELRLDPPTPHEIATMSQIDRDQLLALSSETLHTIFKGFLSGELLQKQYREKEWIPSADLMDAALFAGKGSFPALEDYTYNYLAKLESSIEDVRTDNDKVPTDNIFKALEIQKKLVDGKTRRTGEPVIAHIYRSALRMDDITEYYNNLYADKKTNTRFTSHLKEIVQIATVLHDFEEDRIVQDDKSVHIGITKNIANQSFYLRRAQISRRDVVLVKEDVQLQLDPTSIFYLEKALIALNSSQTDQDFIMDRLMGLVQQQHSSIPLYDIDQYVLSNIPIYVKTGADRPDNLATYFSSQTVTNRHTPTSAERLIAKAQENLTMFNLAELHMLMDGPSLFSSSLVIPEEDEIESPSLLHFFPSRWSKLALLGLSPNQMYTIPEDGGLPELI